MGTPTPAPRLLLVDDRDENLRALTAALRGCGAVLDLARTGAAALERLRAHDYAATIVDVELQEMDGLELVRLMRGSEQATPVLLVTAGEPSPSAESLGYEVGAFDYLHEPLDPHALRSKVRALLELHARRRELAEAAQALRRAVEERDRALAELSAASQRVEESEALLDGIVEAAPIGIGFLDRNLRCRRLNRALAALIGVPRDVNLGPRLSELLPDLVGGEVEARWRDALETGEPLVDLELSGELPRREGRHTWRVTCYPVQRRGESLGLALLVRDVSDEKRAADLQQLLVGIVGHDLRNPLSIVAGAAALLSRPQLAVDARERNVARIRDAGRRMEELIRQLLDYTRARAGAGIAIQPVAGDLEQVLRAVAEDCAAAHPGGEVQVRGEGDGWGCWDVARLQQVFANLVNNGFKYGRRGTAIEVRWTGSADRVRVEVANEGDPIDPGARERIFEPLSQLAAGKRGGIGLGLFIAREIVRAHGGAIDFRSGAGRTTFSVELPRICAPAAPPQEDARAQG